MLRIRLHFSTFSQIISMSFCKFLLCLMIFLRVHLVGFLLSLYWCEYLRLTHFCLSNNHNQSIFIVSYIYNNPFISCYSTYSAIASSAPVWLFPGLSDCNGFSMTATNSFLKYGGENCVKNIQLSWSNIVDIGQSSKLWTNTNDIQCCCKLIKWFYY